MNDFWKLTIAIILYGFIFGNMFEIGRYVIKIIALFVFKRDI